MKTFLFLLSPLALLAQTDLPGPVSALPSGGATAGVCSWNNTQSVKSCLVSDPALTTNAVIDVFNNLVQFDRSIQSAFSANLTSGSSAVNVGSANSTGVGIHLLAASNAIDIDSSGSVNRVLIDPLSFTLRDVGSSTDYVKAAVVAGMGVLSTSSFSLGVTDNVLNASGLKSRALAGAAINCLHADNTGLLGFTPLGECVTTTASQTIIGTKIFSSVDSLTMNGVGKDILTSSAFGSNIGTLATPFNFIWAGSLWLSSSAGSTTDYCVNNASGYTCFASGSATITLPRTTGIPKFSSLAGVGTRSICADFLGNIIPTGCPAGSGTVTSPLGTNRQVTGGISGFSAGNRIISTSLSSFDSIQCTILNVSFGPNTETCQVTGISGGLIQFTSSVAGSSQGFEWFALGF